MPEYEDDDEEEVTVYDEEGREDMIEDGELSPEEEGFMRGYEEADDEAEKEMKELDEEEDV